MAPPESPDDDEQTTLEHSIERSESFQTIIKRHQELSTAQPPTATSPPLKRPGILKKPKDWSSPSPQEIPSPLKEDSVSMSTSSSRKTSVEVTSTTTRKASMESSIEIQLNPVQSSSIVVTEIPADRRNSGASSGVTIQYNSVQDVKMMTGSASSGDRRGSMPRKLSIDVEPSPMMHTSSVTLPTIPAAGVKTTTSSSSSGLVLSGESTGHSVRSTSTFQLHSSGRTSSVAAPVPVPAAADDPTPWRRKSIPREPSNPRDDPPPAAPAAEPIPSRVTSKMSMETSTTSSPILPRSNRTTSTVFPSTLHSAAHNNSGENSTTSTSTTSVTRSSVHSSHRYPPSQPENNAPKSEPFVPRVKTLSATGASVRALAQKFLITGEEKSQPQVVRLSLHFILFCDY